MKKFFNKLKEDFLRFLNSFKDKKTQISFFVPLIIVCIYAVVVISFESCQSNVSSDIPTAYAEDLGIEYYDYSPITGYISFDNLNDGDDEVRSIFNTAQLSEYRTENPDYQGGNDYLVAHFAPYILYPNAVFDDSYSVNLGVGFLGGSGVNGVRVSYVIEYYDEAVGNTPFVEFYTDHTSNTFDVGVYLLEDIVNYMGWDTLDSVFVLSTRIFVSSPSEVNRTGIPTTCGLSFQFDNDSAGISYAGYLYELSDYISFATEDITVVPITNQIVDMVNNFLSLEVFPGVSFYVILLMAVIIPFVVVVLKLWFGG